MNLSVVVIYSIVDSSINTFTSSLRPFDLKTRVSTITESFCFNKEPLILLIFLLVPFWQKKWAAKKGLFWVLLIYSWFNASFNFLRSFWGIRNKRPEVLQNKFLYISSLNWPRSAVKVFLKNCQKNLNLQS